MDFYKIVNQRRSLRKFADKRVERHTIERILEAALKAPSSRNSHSTQFLVVEDRDLIRHMSYMRDYGSAFMAEAPVVVMVMGDKNATDLWIDNCAISATFVQLAAEAEGLGSCWVHVEGREHVKGHPEMGDAESYLRTFLPIPENCGVECVIAMGYSPYEESRPRTVQDNSGKVKWLG
ncbi:MAG: nitroreductase family protein [Tidjanibacter sp.]|nr:nitroreductase family protein [Tidjanibacter sp.]